ncbi:MAG: hypothetical protein EOP84_10780 [Verrucomicrobiaceae bacterium]|nr:MAG: hypothetical protein EOP84_10780 [Verrucomicrobiaceae bacterium]
MADQVIKDRLGRELGRIKDRNGELVAVDRLGRELGKYKPKTNTTHDRLGRELNKGNTLSALILQAQ